MKEVSVENQEAAVRLVDLRARLFDAIRRALEIDSHCKSYEGAFRVGLPNYFESLEGRRSEWVVELDCYVIGPNRHYQWAGETFMDAVLAAERDIDGWIAEFDAEDDD